MFCLCIIIYLFFLYFHPQIIYFNHARKLLVWRAGYRSQPNYFPGVHFYQFHFIKSCQKRCKSKVTWLAWLLTIYVLVQDIQHIHTFCNFNENPNKSYYMYNANRIGQAWPPAKDASVKTQQIRFTNFTVSSTETFSTHAFVRARNIFARASIFTGLKQ